MNARAYRFAAPLAAGLDLAELLLSGEITAVSYGPDGWTATPAAGAAPRRLPTPEHVRAFGEYTRARVAATTRAAAPIAS
ncbi:hypothetical protein [Kitasatospora sp. NPDC057541]|uniref:hypothetical protein n=1 Tax=unclassified Kitasatospora TaxID=2633591 RepID=UPI0036C6DBF1